MRDATAGEVTVNVHDADDLDVLEEKKTTLTTLERPSASVRASSDEPSSATGPSLAAINPARPGTEYFSVP